MINKIALSLFLAATSAAFASTYSGNAATGFGGPPGNSPLTVTDSGGTVDFSLAAGAAIAGADDVVLYIDSVAGGFGDTSTFSDNADGGREAISGFNSTNPSRTLASFAAGFNADYAIVIDGSGNGNLFQLASGANNSLVFQNGVNLGNVGNTYTFNTSLASLGLTQGQSFNFVASLISGTAFRSNETIGTSTVTNPGAAPNAGFTGTLTFSNFDTYQSTAAVPEPATVLLIGPALLGGMFFVRRRRA